MTIRVTHVITGLDVGGAEVMLANVIRHGTTRSIEHTVICLTAGGALANEIRRYCPVIALDLKGTGIRGLVRLARSMRRTAPDIVQTWLYHADLLGGVVGRACGARVIWNVRQSNLGRAYNKLHTRFAARLSALASAYLPSAIIVNSAAAMRAHVRVGYASSKFVLIPNCFDATAFCKGSAWDRSSVRAIWGLAANDIAVGTVARFDAQKGPADFVRMAGLLAARHPSTKFVMIGPGQTPDNALLRSWIAREGLGERVLLLGARRDIPALLNGLDVFVLASHGESFPNALCEAMLCELAVVATDVGDVAEIVGATGKLAAPRDSAALAAAVAELIGAGVPARAEIGRAARESVRARFSPALIVRRYEELYRT